MGAHRIGEGRADRAGARAGLRVGQRRRLVVRELAPHDRPTHPLHQHPRRIGLAGLPSFDPVEGVSRHAYLHVGGRELELSALEVGGVDLVDAGDAPRGWCDQHLDAGRLERGHVGPARSLGREVARQRGSDPFELGVARRMGGEVRAHHLGELGAPQRLDQPREDVEQGVDLPMPVHRAVHAHARSCIERSRADEHALKLGRSGIETHAAPEQGLTLGERGHHASTASGAAGLDHRWIRLHSLVKASSEGGSRSHSSRVRTGPVRAIRRVYSVSTAARGGPP